MCGEKYGVSERVKGGEGSERERERAVTALFSVINAHVVRMWHQHKHKWMFNTINCHLQ